MLSKIDITSLAGVKIGAKRNTYDAGGVVEPQLSFIDNNNSLVSDRRCINYAKRVKGKIHIQSFFSVQILLQLCNHNHKLHLSLKIFAHRDTNNVSF